MTVPVKLGFVTCVQLGLSCLEAIVEAGYRVERVFTLHDNRAVGKSGRVFVDQFARQHGIAVRKLQHVNEAVDEYRQLDWLFIIGWSQIAGPDVIQAPRHGVLGMHPTLLPTGRGRAAIPWAILKGLDRTGVTLFKLDDGVDTGPIVAQLPIPLGPKTTATELYEQVTAAHTQLIRDTLPRLAAGTVELHEQDDSLATVWPGRKPEDGEIDLDGSVHDAERLVRAVTRPYPGAFYRDGEDGKVIVWSAAVADEQPQNGDYLAFRDGYLRLLETETPSAPA